MSANPLKYMVGATGFEPVTVRLKEDSFPFKINSRLSLLPVCTRYRKQWVSKKVTNNT